MNHPLTLARLWWPHVNFYNLQRDLLDSVVENRETVVVSANMMGKDFSVACVVLMFFMCPQMFFSRQYVMQVEEEFQRMQRVMNRTLPSHMGHTRRIVTTSVEERHLGALWGEMGRYIDLCQRPLLESRGGPLVVNDLDIRFVAEREVKRPINWIKGLTADKPESYQGFHASYTLAVANEASGVSDGVIKMMRTWSKKEIYIGNPRECDNYFRHAIKQGDLAA